MAEDLLRLRHVLVVELLEALQNIALQVADLASKLIEAVIKILPRLIYNSWGAIARWHELEHLLKVTLELVSELLDEVALEP